MHNLDILNKFKVTFIMAGFLIGFLVIISVGFIMAPNIISSINSYKVSEDSVKYVKGEGVEISGTNKVKMYDTKKQQVIEIQLEDYVAGVVSAEVPADFGDEALKAQAIAARTFYFSRRLSPCSEAHGGEICDSTHCQVYMSKEERMNSWDKSDAQKNWDKIVSAVDATKGEVLVYDGEIVKHPQFFAISSGKTENSIDVFSDDIPYLKSTDSPGEEIAKKYETATEVKNGDFVSKVNSVYPKANLNEKNIKSSINILSRTEGGGIKEIQIGNVKLTGVEFRKIFNINSTNFTLVYENSKIKIDCKGYGHGVGMSQWGANVMAKEGKTCDEILKHYYTGVEIDKIKYKN
ncbi:stage II sporulation protein D [Clostridium sp. SHJSY1]|uniref:stage II sporulation protein D n=1 Tax=Clostridium sp. SHJSY1 TaxID=2942483 RepID=UPI0028754752|nr:stage II sporulation protein D [Clostridium sp. SHJSY1]MDS0528331.1 stage II sporulation protein D [Clostridium sp. SHJSY1]